MDTLSLKDDAYFGATKMNGKSKGSRIIRSGPNRGKTRTQLKNAKRK